MKNYLLFFTMLIMSNLQAQTYQCKNADGSMETLILTEKGTFTYFSSKAKKQIELKTKNYDGTVETYAVQFPNDNRVYLLKMKPGNIICTNPNGVKQVFLIKETVVPETVEGVFICKNADGSIERLHCIGEVGTDECTLHYSSSKNPKKIKLKVLEYNDDPLPSPSVVQFPGSTQKYKLQWIDGKILCTNPNGVVQVFVYKP